MTLNPGESTQLPVDITKLFCPDVAAAIFSGEKSVTFQKGEQTKIGPDRYRVSVTVLLDNRPHGALHVEFTGEDGADLSFCPTIQRKNLD